MLVFGRKDGRPVCLGNCDLPAPPVGIGSVDTIRWQSAEGPRETRLRSVGFRRHHGSPLVVIQLDDTDTPTDLPGFREADGWA